MNPRKNTRPSSFRGRFAETRVGARSRDRIVSFDGEFNLIAPKEFGQDRTSAPSESPLSRRVLRRTTGRGSDPNLCDFFKCFRIYFKVRISTKLTNEISGKKTLEKEIDHITLKNGPKVVFFRFSAFFSFFSIFCLRLRHRSVSRPFFSVYNPLYR